MIYFVPISIPVLSMANMKLSFVAMTSILHCGDQISCTILQLSSMIDQGEKHR